jgi:hypothetical protein
MQNAEMFLKAIDRSSELTIEDAKHKFYSYRWFSGQ